MYNRAKQGKSQQIKDILRLRFIEKCTYAEIKKQIGVTRPTARKYIDKFMGIVSSEDFIISYTYKDVKRRVPFPARWNKYVKKIVDDYAIHPKTVATTVVKKKIIETAMLEGMSAKRTYDILRKSTDIAPSYSTVAEVIRTYRKKTNPPTE